MSTVMLAMGAMTGLTTEATVPVAAVAALPAAFTTEPATVGLIPA